MKRDNEITDWVSLEGIKKETWVRLIQIGACISVMLSLFLTYLVFK